MKNEEKFKDLMEIFDIRIDQSKKLAESWREVGKNYCCRKDGKPYASVKKAMSGVAGIDGCYTAGGKTFLKNKKGFEISVTGLTLEEVEKEIAEIVEGAENNMRMYSETKKKFMENIEKCDALLDMYFGVVKESSLDPNDTSAMLLRTMIDAYLRNSITKWEYRML